MIPAKACVVGLGIVGIPVAAKLAECGLHVTGLDVDAKRAGAVARGEYPFTSTEPGLRELIATQHKTGRLTATTDAKIAVADADVVLIAVQTPTDADGTPRYHVLKAALSSITPHLKDGALVIVESTLSPGTMRSIVQPTLEATGKKAGKDFLLGHCPERVMPGKLLQNLVHYTRVVGGFDSASTKAMLDLYAAFVKGRLQPTDMTTAEVVKTTENAYRDVEIAFANEVALICQDLGVDAWKVRELVNQVEGRNMHMPGTGVGGHCIPKEGLLLASAARTFKPRLLVLARHVNDTMPTETVRLLGQMMADDKAALKGATVVILGASYLPGSDDVRHTPTTPMAQALESAGAVVRIVDPFVHERLDGRPVHADPLSCLSGAHAVILSTAHPQFLNPDWSAWRKAMAAGFALDGRGAWDAQAARRAGFAYRGIGR